MSRRQVRLRARKLLIPRNLAKHLSFLHSHVRSEGANRKFFFDYIGKLFPRTDARYALIEKSYNTAEHEFHLHKKFRDDGETLYFDHLRSAALIGIVYLRLRDENLIAALLLHDIIEDIPGWTQERLARDFNPDIADLVWWVSKESIGEHLRTKQAVESHFHHKLARAPRRAVIVKLCDRLHNLITLWTHRVGRIRRKVSETRHFIMPLAQEHLVLMHELEAVLELVEHRYRIYS